MTETKWTPGVWLEESGVVNAWVEGEPSLDIYDAADWPDWNEGIANARLIAKAPEMAELLRDLMEVWDPQYEPAKTLYVRSLNLLAEIDK